MEQPELKPESIWDAGNTGSGLIHDAMTLTLILLTFN